MNSPQTNFKEGEQQPKPVDMSFQTMPGSFVRNPGHEPETTNLPVEEEEEGETHPFNNKFTYIVISVLILAVLGGIGYFLLGSGKKENTTNNEQSTSKLHPVWLKQYFNVENCDNQAQCGDEADPDSDGFTNYEEFKVREGTDPNDPDSDGDGLADGDEAHIYKTEPAFRFSFCRGTSGSSCTFDDGTQIANDYDPLTPAIKMTDTRKAQIEADTAKYKLHNPTQETLVKLKAATPPPPPAQ
jgi:hypothetical protein